jgi:hypothetical protein
MYGLQVPPVGTVLLGSTVTRGAAICRKCESSNNFSGLLQNHHLRIIGSKMGGVFSVQKFFPAQKDSFFFPPPSDFFRAS